MNFQEMLVQLETGVGLKRTAWPIAYIKLDRNAGEVMMHDRFLPYNYAPEVYNFSYNDIAAIDWELK